MSDSTVQLPLQADLHLAIDTIRDYAIFLLDPDGVVRSWNRGAAAIKGYEAGEIVGTNFARFYPPEDVQSGKPKRFLERAAREGRAEDQGWRVRKDGTRFWAQAVLTALRGPDGSLRGFVKVTRDLTEQRLASELLRGSEQKFRLLVGSVKDYAIFMLDADGRIATWNAGAQAIKGYSPAEIIGRHMSTFYTPEDLQMGRPAMLLGIAIREGRVEDEGWRVRKDGSRFWADVVITRIDDPEGRLIGFSKVTRDLTSRKEAEGALRQSEERLRLMIESVKDYAIFMLDPEGRVVSWNPGAERLNGYAASEIIGQHFSRFYPPEDAASGRPQMELETAATTGRFEEEGWRVRKDGSRFWSNVTLTPVRDERGDLVGFAKVTRDMTERKRAEVAMVQRARQQAAVAQLGLFALETADLADVIRRAIDSVAEVLGTEMVNVLELSDDGESLVLRASTRADQSSIGRVVSDVDRASQPGHTVVTAEAVQLDRTRFVPGRFLEASGVGSGITALIGAPARPHGAFGVLAAHSASTRQFTIDDVNFLQAVANLIAAALERVRMVEQVIGAEQKTQEERVRTAQAREALRERDEFISVAAHELRTPLTALQLKVQGLERVIRTVPGEAGAKGMSSRLEGALRQIERLARLVERLLDVSRIAGGRLEVSLETFDLAALLRQVADDFREPAASAGSEIHLESPPEAMVTWDRLRIEQVVVNLVANAVKYGRGKPIHMRLTPVKDRFRFSISDEGIGIAAEDLERIFSRFGRAAPVRNYGGLGLGLYIAKHIVEAHGGTIQVSSHVGHGSTFLIDLPAQAVQQVEADEADLRARA